MKKLLIIGGTSFIGRHLVLAFQNQTEYEITLFNRGRTNPELFPELKRIIGDRNIETDLNQIFKTDWDYIIDLSCYYPQSLEWIVKKINSSITKYIFVSTCSVYDNEQYKGMFRDESAPLVSCTPEEAVDTSPSTYGKRKVACEAILKNANIPFVAFRPALVFGPYDPTDRFYYWLHQVKTKKQFGVPENGMRQFSLTYVGDLVLAISKAIRTNNTNAIYNCISYPSMSIHKIIETSAALCNKQVEKISLSASFLKEQNIAEWVDIPVWLHTDDYTYSNERIKDELDFNATDFTKSVATSIAYYEGLFFPTPSFGMDAKKQEDLLRTYSNKKESC